MRAAAICLVVLGMLAGFDTLAAQQTGVAEQVCLRAAGARVTVLADTKRQRVECAPHTVLAGLPALYVAECGLAAGKGCDRPVLAVRALFGKREVLLSPSGTTFELAREVATFLGVTHPYNFNGRNLADMLQGHCLVSDRGAGAFAGARDFRLRCGDRGVLVTKACNSVPCRLFPAQLDDAQ